MLFGRVGEFAVDSNLSTSLRRSGGISGMESGGSGSVALGCGGAGDGSGSAADASGAGCGCAAGASRRAPSSPGPGGSRRAGGSPSAGGVKDVSGGAGGGQEPAKVAGTGPSDFAAAHWAAMSQNANLDVMEAGDNLRGTEAAVLAARSVFFACDCASGVPGSRRCACPSHFEEDHQDRRRPQGAGERRHEIRRLPHRREGEANAKEAEILPAVA